VLPQGPCDGMFNDSVGAGMIIGKLFGAKKRDICSMLLCHFGNFQIVSGDDNLVKQVGFLCCFD